MDIYKFLSIDEAEVKDIIANKNRYYISYPIKKRNKKKMRFIDAPQAELKIIQTAILKKILYKYRAHPIATGFIKNKSAIDGAKKHLGQKVLLCVDIHNFFGSIKISQVTNLLAYLLPKKKEFAGLVKDQVKFHKEVNILAELLTYKSRVPQGAPTSPVISNLICLSIDKRLKALEKTFKCTVSRYADDIAVSSKDTLQIKELIHELKTILASRGFRLNKEKTRVIRSNKRMQVTGIVVNDITSVPKKFWRGLRAKLHNAKLDQTQFDTAQYQKVRGQIEWIRALNPSRGNQLLDQLFKVDLSQVDKCLVASTSYNYQLPDEIVKQQKRQELFS